MLNMKLLDFLSSILNYFLSGGAVLLLRVALDDIPYGVLIDPVRGITYSFTVQEREVLNVVQSFYNLVYIEVAVYLFSTPLIHAHHLFFLGPASNLAQASNIKMEE